MRLFAAIQGNLENEMQAEFNAATEGVALGVKEATTGLKSMLRAQMVSSGLGTRLSKTWQSKFFQNNQMDAAGIVFSKAPHIAAAFDLGATIRVKGKKFLAIPTQETRNMRGSSWRKRMTPQNWPKSKGKLVFVPLKNGDAVLIAVKKYKRKPPVKKVAFVLLRQTKLRKRIDINHAEERIANLLPTLIMKHYRENA